MGFSVELQDEFGGRIDGVDDSKALINKLLPEPGGGDDFPFLRSIDDYGDTTFNGLQMPRFLKEWASVSMKVRTAEEQVIFSAVGSLARRCSNEVHTYLKLIGD